MDRLSGAVVWAAAGVPVTGGLAIRTVKSAQLARRAAVACASGALAAALVGSALLFASDALPALIVPLTAILGFTLVLAAPRAWATPHALGQLLINVGLVIATFLTRDARVVAVLWAATLLPTYVELRRTPGAARPARIYAIYAGASATLFAAGVGLLALPFARGASPRVVGLALLVVAILIRKAALPFHSWLAAAFAAGPPGPVLLLVAPMVGAYALVRFAIPLYPELLGERWFLLGPFALATAAYAAGLAFVQTELRRVVAWIAMSQSALVLVGLDCPHGVGLTGALVTWLSAGTAMTGLGVSAWMLEARFGALRVDRHQGLYRRVPALALVFLLSGLSLVAFPGTVGFASDDLLLGAVLDAFPQAGILLFVATALNGFTVLRAYMRLFHGAPAAGPELGLLGRERVALLVPLVLVIWAGVYPGPLVRLGNEASRQVLASARASASQVPWKP